MPRFGQKPRGPAFNIAKGSQISTKPGVKPMPSQPMPPRLVARSMAPVLFQPALPLHLNKARKSSLDSSLSALNGASAIQPSAPPSSSYSTSSSLSAPPPLPVWGVRNFEGSGRSAQCGILRAGGAYAGSVLSIRVQHHLSDATDLRPFCPPRVPLHRRRPRSWIWTMGATATAMGRRVLARPTFSLRLSTGDLHLLGSATSISFSATSTLGSAVAMTFLELATSVQASIILLQETLLSPLGATQLANKLWQFFHQSGRRNHDVYTGGVAILVRRDLTCAFVASNTGNYGEWISVAVHNFFITSAYRRNNLSQGQTHTWNLRLTDHLASLPARPWLVGGDFNHLPQEDVLWPYSALYSPLR